MHRRFPDLAAEGVGRFQSFAIGLPSRTILISKSLEPGILFLRIWGSIGNTHSKMECYDLGNQSHLQDFLWLLPREIQDLGTF